MATINIDILRELSDACDRISEEADGVGRLESCTFVIEDAGSYRVNYANGTWTIEV